MKNKFSHFYTPSEKRIKNLWDKCLFIFDTNILLNLYRCSASSRKDFLEKLKSKRIESRIWIPYQVGYELHNNKEVVIKSEISNYDKIINDLGEIDSRLNKVKELIASKKSQPHIKSKFIDDIKIIIVRTKRDLSKERDKYAKLNKHDFVLSSLNKYFKNKIGENYSEERLREIIEEVSIDI